MKNLKSITIILALALSFVSCEKYDDFGPSELPVVGFTKDRNINSIRAGEPKSIDDVEVFSSSVSTSDRTFNITVVPIVDTEEFPPTDRENFSFDTSVTIPANERSGFITVTGINTTLTTDRTYFRLAIESDPSVVAGALLTIGLKGR